MLCPFNAVKIDKRAVQKRQTRGGGVWQTNNAGFVGFGAQKINNGVERADLVLLFVIPVDDVGQVRPAQIHDQKCAEQQAAQLGARAGKITGDSQREQGDGAGEKQ